jgi:NAD(P)-dependent dehydrogenase (short-subunit alcohol dehydrogenase family)
VSTHAERDAAPVIVVTGANRGIGFEICRQLAARGAQVVLTARDRAAGEVAVKKLAPSDCTAAAARFHLLDVNDDTSAAALGEFVRTTFGHLDVLVNNAGIIADGDDSILTVTPAAVQGTLATNTVAPLRLTQALLPLLRKSVRGGRVINVSSGAGELTDFDGSWAPAYSLSKAALNLVTRMLAPALARDGIAVNAMCPGWVRTDMGGAGAPRDVAQGADTAVWLALDAPAKLTGKFFRDRKEIAW